MANQKIKNNINKPVTTGNNKKVEKDEDLKDLSKRFFEVKKTMYQKDIEKRNKEIDDLEKTIEDLKIEIKDLNKEIEYINEKIKFTESEIENDSINLLIDEENAEKLLEFYEAFIEIDDILKEKIKEENESDNYMSIETFLEFCNIRNVDPLEIMDKLDPELSSKIVSTKS